MSIDLERLALISSVRRSGTDRHVLCQGEFRSSESELRGVRSCYKHLDSNWVIDHCGLLQFRPMKTLGLIGGIGPESTIEYYRYIIAGYRQQKPDGGYPAILVNSVNLTQLIEWMNAR